MSKKPIAPPQKTSFGAAPEGYIAGFGRGAVGFITRSDIGPSKINGEAQFFGITQGPDDEDRGDYSETKYDKWAGYEGSLFSNQGDMDDEDREAEECYINVDSYMNSRRKDHREKRIQEELVKFRKENPTINDQFKDAKRQLSTLSVDEWMAIPEAHDFKVKKQKREKYVPVPDKIIEAGRSEGQIDTNISASDGLTSGTKSSLTELGQARGQVLSLHLTKAEDSATGQTNVDPKGYVTQLDSIANINAGIDIGDWKKTRALLKNAVETDPKNAAVWIAAARVEELDGKLQAARNFINQALTYSQDSEDLWLEAARLETVDKSRAVLAKAVSQLPHSAKIWLAAADKESDKTMKKKILQRALEYNPKNLRLWKELIETGSEEEARDYLYKAVKCLPNKLELWLALAKLENYDNARVVLNEARTELPTEIAIWIYAAELEETQGNLENVEPVIRRAIKILVKNGATVKREDWMREADTAEKSGSIQTAMNIIKCTAEIGVDADELEKTWLEDAENLIKNKSINCARALYDYSTNKFPERESLWITRVDFERKFGNQSTVDQILEQSLEKCGKSEVLWLMSAKNKWQRGDIGESRAILKRAFDALPNNESIYLAAAKLERELGAYEEAREIYVRARSNCDAPKIWMQSVQLERELNKNQEALNLAKEALKKHPNFPKLWMIAGQIYEKLGDNDLARKYFEEGTNYNKTSVPLWNCLINLEAKLGNFPKARSVWEKARVKNPNQPDLWFTAIKLEELDKNQKGAVYMLNRALQECPKSGELWGYSIELEPRHLRTAKSVEAMKHCDNDPHVILAVARQFWREKKYEKAKKWLERGISVNKDFGDVWIYYYLFEKLHGDSADEVLIKCRNAEPHHGRLWIDISKKPENWRMKPDEILAKAVEKIKNEFDESG